MAAVWTSYPYPLPSVCQQDLLSCDVSLQPLQYSSTTPLAHLFSLRLSIVCTSKCCTLPGVMQACMQTGTSSVLRSQRMGIAEDGGVDALLVHVHRAALTRPQRANVKGKSWTLKRSRFLPLGAYKQARGFCGLG